MTFTYQGTVEYTGALLKYTCTALLTDGSPCGISSVYSHTCPYHTAKLHNLVIRPSTLPNAGLGLFATTQFYSPMILGEYKGEVLTQAQIDARYGKGPKDFGPYALMVHKNYILDAAVERCLGAYINDGRDVKPSNVKWVCKHDKEPPYTPHMFLVAIQDIRIDDEILVSYGADYWECLQEGPSYNTRYD
jgi:hypothetical protein